MDENTISSVRQKGNPNDSGAALALVLVIVVFLALWLAAATFFNQSSNLAVSKTIEESNRRAALVSEALNYTLDQLTFNHQAGTIHRWGVNDKIDANSPPGPLSCTNKTQDELKPIPYIGPNGERVLVQCTESDESGKQYPLASYVLTGTNNSCPAGGCEIGRESGLRLVLNGSSDCTAIEAARLSIRGGIINSSGAWRGVGCDTLKLEQSVDEKGATREAFIKQPTSFANGCNPASEFSSGAVYGSGSGNNKVNLCVCPTVAFQLLAATSVTSATDKCTEPESSTDLDPDNPSSELKAYLDSVAANLGVPNQLARWTSATLPASATVTATTVTMPLADLCSFTAGSGNKLITWIPGTLSSMQIAILNAQQDKCVDSGGSAQPWYWIMSPGVYRVTPDTSTSCSALSESRQKGSSTGSSTITITYTCANTISVSRVIVGGTPIGLEPAVAAPGGFAREACQVSALSPVGVELQFEGASYLEIASGRMILCPRKDDSSGVVNPVISAPTQGSPSDFFRANTVEPFFTMPATSNADPQTCLFCLVAYGSVFAPAGSAQMALNGKAVDVRFEKGAVFEAMEIGLKNNVRAGGSVSPPPPFNGDRIVQLRFYVVECPVDPATPCQDTDVQRDLGVVQVLIKDYYGRRLASGYKILAWRTYW